MDTPQVISLALAGIGMLLIVMELLLGLDSYFDLVLSGLALLIGGSLGFFTNNAFIAVTVSLVGMILYWAVGRVYVRKWLQRQPHKSNVDRLEGEQGKVVRKLSKSDRYLVKVGGEEWVAEADGQLSQGDAIIVQKVAGTTLHVTKS